MTEIIDVTITLCKQEISFRTPLESGDSNNPGNFKTVFNLILNRNVELKEQWGKMSYFQELSKTIQNELMESILDEIQCYID